jgi:hypothetical protein
MPIRYKPEANILWIIFPGTINWTTYLDHDYNQSQNFTRDDYLRDPRLRLYTFSHCPDSGTAQKSILSHMGTQSDNYFSVMGKTE